VKSKNDIINELCHDAEFKNICNKISKHKSEDFYSETILQIMEQPSERLEEIYQKGINGFKLYCTYIAWNMYRNKYSPFNKKYAFKYVELTNTQLFEKVEQINAEELLNAVNKRIDFINESYKGQFPYDVKMLELYISTGSLRKMAKATGIPHTTCYNSINRIKNQISDAINLEHFIG